MPFAVRPHFDWRLRTRSLALGARTLIMGILNATPDSFSDGGRFLDPRAALTHALQMLDDGADILDLGGESTRPNSTPITPPKSSPVCCPSCAQCSRRVPMPSSPSTPITPRPHASPSNRARRSSTMSADSCGTKRWPRPAPRSPAERSSCTRAAARTSGARCPPSRPMKSSRSSSANSAPAVKQRSPQASVATPSSSIPASASARHSTKTSPCSPASTRSTPSASRCSPASRAKASCAMHFSKLTNVTRRILSHHRIRNHALQDATTAANTAAILAGAHILRVHEVRPARAAAAIADRILAAR